MVNMTENKVKATEFTIDGETFPADIPMGALEVLENEKKLTVFSIWESMNSGKFTPLLTFVQVICSEYNPDFDIRRVRRVGVSEMIKILLLMTDDLDEVRQFMGETDKVEDKVEDKPALTLATNRATKRAAKTK
jgi:hypothetical protein